MPSWSEISVVSPPPAKWWKTIWTERTETIIVETYRIENRKRQSTPLCEILGWKYGKSKKKQEVVCSNGKVSALHSSEPGLILMSHCKIGTNIHYVPFKNQWRNAHRVQSPALPDPGPLALWHVRWGWDIKTTSFDLPNGRRVRESVNRSKPSTHPPIHKPEKPEKSTRIWKREI